MCSTCIHPVRMAKMIQLRNVPDELHRKLKARAAQAGMSLSDYLLEQIKRDAEAPTVEELIARLESWTPVKMSKSAAQIIREEREKRDRQLDRRR